jgi:4-azaleucine resistance transporter AzlC
MVRLSLRSSEPPEADIVTLTGRGFRAGLLALLPIALFTLPFGLAFGAAAIDTGLSSVQVIAMSTLVFSGAAQFAALDVWMTPPSFFTVFLTVLAVSARHLILGASISPWVNGRPPQDRIFVLLFLSDPNFAHGSQAFRSGERDIGTLVGGGMILWFCWVVGTAVGAIGGSTFGDLTLFGIDVLMVSYFAALAAGNPRTRTNLAAAAAAMVAAVLSLSILPVGWNVVVAAIIGGLVGSFQHDD